MHKAVVNETQKLTRLLGDLRFLENRFDGQLTKYAMDTSDNELKESTRNSVLDSLQESIVNKKQEIKDQSQIVQDLIAKI